ncbi:hypothetical protein [Mesobacillus harenae]|uniref:hypothetical protein n=1 Tax=Mesobacillus harenae TaxID=2213203 RepID=UPI00158050A0|nr:hypothetical protein [Mesobacillus harenae]
MLNLLVKMKCKFHLFLQRHNEALVQDALSDDLKSRLKAKASYHGQIATLLTSKLN